MRQILKIFMILCSLNVALAGEDSSDQAYNLLHENVRDFLECQNVNLEEFTNFIPQDLSSLPEEVKTAKMTLALSHFLNQQGQHNLALISIQLFIKNSIDITEDHQDILEKIHLERKIAQHGSGQASLEEHNKLDFKPVSPSDDPLYQKINASWESNQLSQTIFKSVKEVTEPKDIPTLTNSYKSTQESSLPILTKFIILIHIAKKAHSLELIDFCSALLKEIAHLNVPSSILRSLNTLESYKLVHKMGYIDPQVLQDSYSECLGILENYLDAASQLYIDSGFEFDAQLILDKIKDAKTAFEAPVEA